MRDSIKIALGIILVLSAAVLLCLLIPALVLLELFLVLLGGLILAVGISLLDDLIHYHKIGQKLREIELERQRQKLLLLDHNRISTSHYRNQRRSRRLRGGGCC